MGIVLPIVLQEFVAKAMLIDHLIVVPLEQLQEAGLRARGALDPAEEIGRAHV